MQATKMLKDSFYTVSELEVEGTRVAARILLNLKHPIYQGHFPDNPITPGVCQIQIIKETLGEVYSKPMVLKSAKNIKFVNVLVPQKNPIDLTMDFAESEPGLNVSATLAVGETVFLKFSGYFESEISDPA